MMPLRAAGPKPKSRRADVARTPIARKIAAVAACVHGRIDALAQQRRITKQGAEPRRLSMQSSQRRFTCTFMRSIRSARSRWSRACRST